MGQKDRAAQQNIWGVEPILSWALRCYCNKKPLNPMYPEIENSLYNYRFCQLTQLSLEWNDLTPSF